MALRFSTGLLHGLMNATGIKEAMADGILRIYSGAQPATADAAVTGTLLLEITKDGGAWSAGSATNGLEFDAPADRVLSKAAAENWQGDGLANGTAGWFRFFANPTDAGGVSTTLARIDGSVGQGTGDLKLGSTAINASAPTTIDEFSIGMTQL